MSNKIRILVILLSCLYLTVSSAQCDSVICAEKSNEMFSIISETAPIFDNDTFNSDMKLLKYVHGNLRINTQIPNSIPIEMIVAQFTVTKEGKVEDVSFPRGARLAEETNIREVLLCMPDWTPGRMGETPIGMKITLPIRIDLKD